MTERKVSGERVSEDFVEQVAKEIAKHTYARCLPQMSDCEDWDAMEEADRKIYRAAAEAVLALRSSVKTVDEELLIDNAATASQNRTLIEDPVTREAIKLNIINPLLSSVKTGTRVKDLEWELMGGDSWRAPALFFGSFRVESYAEGYIVLWSAPGIADTFVGGRWPNAEAAKSAAQADYERRILSAIEAPAAASEVTEEMLDRAVDAVVLKVAPVGDYLNFSVRDAQEFGVLDDGEEFNTLDIIRSDQWRECQKFILRPALTAALKGDRS